MRRRNQYMNGAGEKLTSLGIDTLIITCREYSIV